MTPNPIRYYTAHTPGDDTLLNDLELRYGSYFQFMNARDKFFLLNTIAMSLSVEAAGETSNQVIALNLKLQALDFNTRVSLIKFLADQL